MIEDTVSQNPTTVTPRLTAEALAELREQCSYGDAGEALCIPVPQCASILDEVAESRAVLARVEVLVRDFQDLEAASDKDGESAATCAYNYCSERLAAALKGDPNDRD